jgi:hypothetical protein
MHILRHPFEVLAYAKINSDPNITALIQQRMDDLIDEESSMEDLVVIVILESGDGVEQLQSEICLRVQTDLGSPLWEMIEEHSTCYELVFVMSSSGYGALVFAPKTGLAPDMLALCQEHAYRSPPYPPPDESEEPISTVTARRGGFFTPVQTKGDE